MLNEVEKRTINDSIRDDFWLGRIIDIIRVGEYQIVEFYPKKKQGTKILNTVDFNTVWYEPYINGTTTCTHFGSLDECLIGMVAIKKGYDDVSGYIFKMLGMNDES